MISPQALVAALAAKGITEFVGVPDSLLKPLISLLDRGPRVSKHVIAANEGAAIGFAIGVHLETGKPAAVYLQNSGLGNAVNPLTALAHRGVYGTPMVLLIGWRGEPGRSDEPQHLVQGEITLKLLELMGIPFVVVDQNSNAALDDVSKLIDSMRASPGPVAVVISAGVLEEIHVPSDEDEMLSMTREEALSEVLSVIPAGDRVIATTGMLGRELWEMRNRRVESVDHDFLVVGGMGHAAAIAHGVAFSNADCTVWCLDGDGSLLMHLGTLAVIGDTGTKNLKHVLFNNFSHDSVGGQPTAARSVDFERLCNSLSYVWAGSASSPEKATSVLENLSHTDGPVMAELRVKKGARSDLGRPPVDVFIAGTRFYLK